jgi:hypothetical protein
VTQRILLSLLLAWLAIAPAIANSCAAECGSGARSAHYGAELLMEVEQSGLPDCHGRQGSDEPADTQLPDGGSMAAACFVAGAVSMPSSFVPGLKIDMDTERYSAVLVPAASFETCPPIKPPQA